jgi:type I restriction enzyme S subunit
MWFINSPPFRAQIATFQSGSTRQRISRKNLASIQLPIPPRLEQDRIVNRIDDLISDLDSGVAALERARANLKKYRAAVLRAAVTGELTAEWRAAHPNVEPAQKLLERILAERRRKWEADQRTKYEDTGKTPPKNWQEKYEEVSPQDVLGLSELPSRWCWATVNMLLKEPLRNGHSARASRTGEGIRTLILTAVTYGDFYEKNTKLTIARAEDVEDLWLQPDDFLIERSNTPELVGIARRYKGVAGYAIFPDLLVRIRILPQVFPGFFEVVLLSDAARSYFRSRAKGLAGSMPKIDQPTILRLPVPLPPFEEQKQIAADVEQRLSIIEATENYLAASLKRAARLRQSILKEAFAGRLVPQDPADEPASVLLERLRAERQTGIIDKAKPTRSRRAPRSATPKE